MIWKYKRKKCSEAGTVNTISSGVVWKIALSDIMISNQALYSYENIGDRIKRKLESIF